jgi:large subunit ribosomal protein L33
VAKKTKNLWVKLVSTADTGYFIVRKRNPKTKTEKLEFKRYDPKVRKHVVFKETKLK